MRVYNTRSLSQNQRFYRALVYGILCALGCGVGLGILQRMLPIQFQLFYVGVGYAVAYVVREYGRGVHVKFSYLAGGLTLVALLLADAITIGGFFQLWNPLVWLMVLRNWVQFTSLWGILSVAFRLGAVYLAYEQGRYI